MTLLHWQILCYFFTAVLYGADVGYMDGQEQFTKKTNNAPGGFQGPAAAEGFEKFTPTETFTNYVKSSPSHTVSFARAFNVLVNYWEIKPTQYEQVLADLALKEISTVAAFVPWNHAETDIYHSLKKFLRAAYATNLKVKLFVMPELGLNYPSVGIPKDLLQNNSNLAVDKRGQIIYNLAAPNIFPLPSFYSPEVIKRFGNFLIKVAGVLGELSAEFHQSEFCDLYISNTFFNYYRSQGLSADEHGDYSAAHVMAFRDFLEKEYPGAAGENFKRQVYESHNRHRFISNVERSLREKTEMIFSRKNSRFRLVHGDLMNPECAPDLSKQSLLCEVFDFKPSVTDFYREICDSACRREGIYFNGSGVFRKFSEQEKSFLMLASLIHTGEVTAGSEEVAKLSHSFKRKLSSVLSIIKEQDYFLVRKLRYISSSKFSGHKSFSSLLPKMAHGIYVVENGISPVTDSRLAFHEKLVVIDPKYVIRNVDFLQILTLAQTGKVVVVAAPGKKTANYLPDAIASYEKFKKGRPALKVNLGLSYEVYDYQLGKVVFYESDSFWSEENNLANSQQFLKSMMGLADIAPVCEINDSRLQVVCHVSSHDPADKLLFLVNPTTEALTAKLAFEKNVGLVAIPKNESSEMIIGKTFELNVPPLGVISMNLVESLPKELAEGESQWN